MENFANQVGIEIIAGIIASLFLIVVGWILKTIHFNRKMNQNADWFHRKDLEKVFDERIESIAGNIRILRKKYDDFCDQFYTGCELAAEGEYFDMEDGIMKKSEFYKDFQKIKKLEVEKPKKIEGTPTFIGVQPGFNTGQNYAIGNDYSKQPIWEMLKVEQPEQCKKCVKPPYNCDSCSIPHYINTGIGGNALKSAEKPKEETTR